MLEREVKLSFDSADQARAAVMAARATLLRPRRLQHDILFDTPDQHLRQRGCALRLRHDGDAGYITFKGQPVPGVMKVREERETRVDDLVTMRLILEQLGYRAWFTYQKFREEYEAPGVVIAIDDTPVGTWVEIEGAEERIVDMASALGRTADDFVVASYRALFVERRAQFALGDDMIFPAR